MNVRGFVVVVVVAATAVAAAVVVVVVTVVIIAVVECQFGHKCFMFCRWIIRIHSKI